MQNPTTPSACEVTAAVARTSSRLPARERLPRDRYDLAAYFGDPVVIPSRRKSRQS